MSLQARGSLTFRKRAGRLFDFQQARASFEFAVSTKRAPLVKSRSRKRPSLHPISSTLTVRSYPKIEGRHIHALADVQTPFRGIPFHEPAKSVSLFCLNDELKPTGGHSPGRYSRSPSSSQKTPPQDDDPLYPCVPWVANLERRLPRTLGSLHNRLLRLSLTSSGWMVEYMTVLDELIASPIIASKARSPAIAISCQGAKAAFDDAVHQFNIAQCCPYDVHGSLLNNDDG
ncbi:hypothetical protein C8R46DRAFT_1215136 [Mycena filopes]|nr:hypothetical protein C8R46DRAFT_1215136 [Mycena filopes]